MLRKFDLNILRNDLPGPARIQSADDEIRPGTKIPGSLPKDLVLGRMR